MTETETISTKIPKIMAQNIDKFIKKGMFNNRSDFTREAIRAHIYYVEYKLAELTRG